MLASQRCFGTPESIMFFCPSYSDLSYDAIKQCKTELQGIRFTFPHDLTVVVSWKTKRHVRSSELLSTMTSQQRRSKML